MCTRVKGLLNVDVALKQYTDTNDALEAMLSDIADNFSSETVFPLIIYSDLDLNLLKSKIESLVYLPVFY